MTTIVSSRTPSDSSCVKIRWMQLSMYAMAPSYWAMM
jgi:hypothetical protein